MANIKIKLTAKAEEIYFNIENTIPSMVLTNNLNEIYKIKIKTIDGRYYFKQGSTKFELKIFGDENYLHADVYRYSFKMPIK